MKTIKTLGLATAVISAMSGVASAQDATIIYRLGRDTVAVEQMTRTSPHLAGETLLRQGTALTRSQYDVTLSSGRVTTLVFRRRQADGSPIPNNPTEWRFTFRPDSSRREIVWKDSTQSQTFAVKNAFLNIP